MRCQYLAALLAIFATTGGCAADPLIDRYNTGVGDAAVATEGEIATDLVKVTKDNETLVWNADKSRVLVVTWKAEGAYKNFIEGHNATSPSEDYVVWVTLAPKMQQRCQAFSAANPSAGSNGVNLYLKQFLGLYPEWNYDLFVELWVPPESLFRPCVDPQTDDSTCDLQFGDKVPAVTGIKDYKAFYEALYFKSFRYPPGVPWTGLGYTYNWGGNPSDGSEKGASEFILSPGTPYTVERTVPTAEYCAPKG